METILTLILITLAAPVNAEDNLANALRGRASNDLGHTAPVELNAATLAKWKRPIANVPAVQRGAELGFSPSKSSLEHVSGSRDFRTHAQAVSYDDNSVINAPPSLRIGGIRRLALRPLFTFGQPH
eukprot:gnl/MRDRNA2_/MRDRNA2_202658_c0_seq1.p1 gnl/MRDRNA2_/MRDRNA2_202658_c0~~gnl/MRDRNA2_/MRDRNA2_202658_c0_seq1.p1  ORF type:complete len:126 (+),score=15.05 gnl/MRDRNA2_/MRDRNA2_202658_c0_seq1:139-516(+)